MDEPNTKMMAPVNSDWPQYTVDGLQYTVDGPSSKFMALENCELP